jgi:hypothetical protein
MSMIFILIQSKFDIYINKDELLETIWEHKKKKKKKKKKNNWLSLLMHNNMEPKHFIFKLIELNSNDHKFRRIGIWVIF